jgi:hypothetical protein
LRDTIERLLEADRFNMGNLCREVWPLVEDRPHTAAAIAQIKASLSPGQYKKLCEALLRAVFLIELVNQPAIETTKFRTRWFTGLSEDQRYCSFDECIELLNLLLVGLPEWLAVEQHHELLVLFFEESLLPYEAPLDYVEVPETSDTATRIHRLGNLNWAYTDLILRTVKLRKLLADSTLSPDPVFFKKVLDEKVKIKTYLTDRALTGNYKTNREKRWETHPHSVQFATRTACLEIEYKLVTQLCAFKDFPPASYEMLRQQNVVPMELPLYRCPVTLEPLSFLLFRTALLNPQHGKSDFQVGHLNPLKLDQPGTDTAGHSADNVSWISADGNRIQGSLSLHNVQDLLRKIATNYEQLGLVGRPASMDSQT